MKIKLGVRRLVEYAYRSGSISQGFSLSIAANEGTRLHRIRQAQYNEGDQKEVPLSAVIEHEGTEVILEGRCDGLLVRDDRWVIEEIKSTKQLAGTEDRFIHWAQGICYGYMLCEEKELSHIDVWLTYIQLDTHEVKTFKKTFKKEECFHHIEIALCEYIPFALTRLHHQLEKVTSSKKLSFPYGEFRANQRELAGAVYQGIKNGKIGYIGAPTGTGKTISTIFPWVKSVGEGQSERLIYTTARTSTKGEVEKTFQAMTVLGLDMQTVTITAKEKICPRTKSYCNQEHCEWSKGYYDRLNEGLMDILENERVITRNLLERYSEKHTLCPFEFSLDVAYEADVIICDYHYIFDLRVSLQRLAEDQRKSTILLVDEAHNLVERGMEMYSADLRLEEFYDEGLQTIGSKVAEVGEALSEWMGQGSSTFYEVEEMNSSVLEQIVSLVKDIEHSLASVQDTVTDEHLLTLYFSLQHFLKISAQLDERYIILIDTETGKIKLKNIQPSKQIQKNLKTFQSAFLFSATFEPFDYFSTMLGKEEDSLYYSIPTPFSKDQLDVYIAPINTRYHKREQSVPSITMIVKQLLAERPGNYLLFFPSYSYLQLVENELHSVLVDVELLVQQPGMSDREKELFLEKFQLRAKENEKNSKLGLAVLGGVFSEGINLEGDALIGVMVVGVGLPMLTNERDLMKNQWTSQGFNGFAYAYQYPGMHKVIQAGGRVIRTSKDKGTLVLIDDRYLTPFYQEVLPAFWQPYRLV
ncbi:hypothetical protein Q75_01500 [Bacillus coahuilensis p1.1.43]|uniref:Helicase ATP-binding domain-containing protein n=1 Tax=Bacillus coahuilensis p1.1.43 TaxID=1150625 RepID=A0A147KC61_9BACI|nr:ATP-dependent DNA helicase [Bacillus coahuilensis]KUP09139.1 hypothetical protein Q75_01500 [Bacillus coahuilensis p1.1.43]